MRKNLTLDGLSDLPNKPLFATLATNYADGTTLLSPESLNHSSLESFEADCHVGARLLRPDGSV